MLSWIGNAVSSIASWLGGGISKFFSWLLGGINTVLSKLVEASRVFWDLLDAIWDFLVGFKDSLLSLFSAWFPWIPAAVNLMKIEFTIFGVTLTFWNLMLYLMAGGIIVYLIVRFLHD